MPATRPRIFVSHSSADKELTAKVRDLIRPPGEAEPKCELFLDIDRLDEGRPWEPYLHEWLARCHAGLVLLTENSVTSDWVLKEATILAWRVSLDPSFKLFIACSPGVELEGTGYGPLGLRKIQWLEDASPEQIATSVRAGIADTVPEPTPFDLLVGKLAAVLKKVDDGILEVVARKLRVFAEWMPGDDERTRHVQAVARHLICGGLGEYRSGPLTGLQALMGDLAGATGKEPLLQALKLMGMHWVDGAAAGHLALLPGQEDRRAVALNGDYVPVFTAETYLTRAHLAAAESYYFLPVGGGHAGGMVEHYTEEICEAMRTDPSFARLFSGRSDEQVIEGLKRMTPVRYVVIPDPLPNNDDLEELVDLFPTINFVLCAGPELIRNQDLVRVDWVEPALDRDVEYRQLEDYTEAEATVKRQENT